MQDELKQLITNFGNATSKEEKDSISQKIEALIMKMPSDSIVLDIETLPEIEAADKEKWAEALRLWGVQGVKLENP